MQPLVLTERNRNPVLLLMKPYSSWSLVLFLISLSNLAMAQEGKACCPPGSEPYLQSEYAATGSIESVPYGDGATLEMYCPPRQKEGLTSAVIVAPDVWGWNGGRTRAIADSIAAKGHIVVVPKLLATPAMDGGTDGDALGPDSKFSMGTCRVR